MIELRKAGIEDLDVLKYWDKQEHVIASDPNDDWNWEYELTRNPEWREQLIAELDERPIGSLARVCNACEKSDYDKKKNNRRRNGTGHALQTRAR
jgi:aminoglycoside 6'-N-acetyltransferase